MDVADRAQRDTETYEGFRSVRTLPEIKGTGKCLYCGEKVDGARRWCCPECRDAWEKERMKYVFGR